MLLSRAALLPALQSEREEKKINLLLFCFSIIFFSLPSQGGPSIGDLWYKTLARLALGSAGDEQELSPR